MPHPVEPVDLRDTIQNAAVQDILAGTQQFAELEDDFETMELCDKLIECVQEHYVPPQLPRQIPVEVQSKIRQLETRVRTMSRELESIHKVNVALRARIRSLENTVKAQEADIAQAVRMLQGN